MFEASPQSVRWVLTRARDEAAELGAADVEAEHVLLALTLADDALVKLVLARAHVEHDALRQAMQAQDEAALACVGVSREAFGMPPSQPLRRTPGWATSTKQAIMRARKIAKAHDRGRMSPGDLMLGVLRAQAGSVPRALAFAGVDPVALAVETETELDRAS